MFYCGFILCVCVSVWLSSTYLCLLLQSVCLYLSPIHRSNGPTFSGKNCCCGNSDDVAGRNFSLHACEAVLLVLENNQASRFPLLVSMIFMPADLCVVSMLLRTIRPCVAQNWSRVGLRLCVGGVHCKL